MQTRSFKAAHAFLVMNTAYIWAFVKKKSFELGWNSKAQVSFHKILISKSRNTSSFMQIIKTFFIIFFLRQIQIKRKLDDLKIVTQTKFKWFLKQIKIISPFFMKYFLWLENEFIKKKCFENYFNLIFISFFFIIVIRK